MWFNKAVTLHSNVSRNYLTITHPAQAIHPIVIHFAKGLCQLSTPLTRHRTIAETWLLSPHARQGELVTRCSRDSELQLRLKVVRMPPGVACKIHGLMGCPHNCWGSWWMLLTTFERGVGLDNLQRSFPTSTTLWLCNPFFTNSF